MLNYSVDDCKRYILKLNEEYKSKHLRLQEREELIAENNIEKRDVKGYHGREILELLQNADDAYQKSINQGEKPNCDLEVHIKYVDNILTVSNSGTYFDYDGVKAIVQGNNSPKVGQYIGSKGTGFRSILNWAKEIKIFSGNFRLKFSKDIANGLFEEIKNEEQIRKQINRVSDLYIPILAYPEYIENENRNDEKTTIEIVVDESKINDDYNVDKQLRNIDSKILLFLPNTKSIIIETKDFSVKFIREREDDKNVSKEIDVCNKMALISLKRYENDEVVSSEDYDLFERVIKNKFMDGIDKKDVHLAIAVPYKIEDVDDLHLYTYFPLLETKSPFNCIMHATYELGDQRNTIIADAKNKSIIIEQLKFLVYIAETYYIKNKEYDKALELLIPRKINNSFYNFSFDTGFSNFKVENEYINLLKDIKIFLTVNDKLLSFNDKPQVIKNAFPKFIKGDLFDDLLESSISEKAEILLKLINRSSYFKEYDEKVLCDKLSILAENLSVYDRVYCYDWWEQNYENYLPKLLKNQNDEWLDINSECYFLDGDFDNIEIPKWIKIPSIHEEYQKSLFEIVKSNSKYIEYRKSDKYIPTSRLISNNAVYNLIKFKYRDKSTIVSTLNSSINNYDNAVEFVKWVWKYYKDEENWIPPSIQTLKYKLPTTEKNTIEHTRVYLGREYGNELSEKLYSNEYKKFPPLEIFDIDSNELENFKLFISKFEVQEYPKIMLGEIDENSAYGLMIQKLMRKDWISVIKSLSINIKTIDKFDKIIEKLSTQEILRWISEDSELFKELNIKVYNNKYYRIKYKNNLYNDKDYNSRYIDNYLLYILNHTKWILIRGKKYSPKEIVIELGLSKIINKIGELVPVITRDYIKDMSDLLKIDYNKIIEIFDLFDFCKHVTDLSSNEFYQLMLELPRVDKNIGVEISRYIYRIIERNDFDREYEYSENKNLFFKEGKLLTKKGEFISATEVYLPSTLIVNKNSYHILDKGTRTNNDKFIKIFNCKEYDRSPTVKQVEIHENNNYFQKEIIEFKNYAKAYNGLNSEIEKNLDKLSIILVSKIIVSIDDEEEIVKDNYIEIRESQTKWYITIFEQKYDKLELSRCIENIFSNIANTPGFECSKYGELFRLDKKGKDFLITKDFGYCDFITDDLVAEDVKQKFITVMKKINNEFVLEEFIDFGNIDSIDTIEKVINILNDEKISNINVLYDNGFDIVFNLKKYYQHKIEYIISQNENEYKNYLFTQALENVAKQTEFLDNWYKFKNYKVDESIDNIIDVYKFLFEKFGNWRIKNLENANEKYELNYKELNPNNKFAEEISCNDEIKQWIFFKNSEKFNEWLQKNMEDNNEEIKSDDAVLNRFKGVVPDKTDIVYSSEEQKKIMHNQVKRDYVFVEGRDEQKRKRQKQIGNSGELIIYNLLCEKYGSENVFPRSEAFVSIGLLTAGLEKSGDYDIEYLDTESNERYFVEVKTGNSNSFDISPRELEFAKNHSKNYKLFVVFNLDMDTPRYSELPYEFWNDEKYKKEEIIERIHITF